MESINVLDHIVGIGITLLTTGFFAMIGFIWRISHKVSSNTKTLSDHDRRINYVGNQVEKLNDKTYSIVKNLD